MILALDVLHKLFACLGYLAILFHLVDVLASGHNNDLELIIIVHPDFNQSVQAKRSKDGADLVAFKIQISSLSKGNDSLLVLYLFVRIDNHSNNEVDHQNVQEVGKQEP